MAERRKPTVRTLLVAASGGVTASVAYLISGGSIRSSLPSCWSSAAPGAPRRYTSSALAATTRRWRNI
jgi:hypothetical protein